MINENIPLTIDDYKTWYYSEENFQSETWFPIIYNEIKEGLYEVSDFGRVRKTDKAKPLLSPVKRNDGYLTTSLLSTNSRGRKTVSIHRLVATAFIKNDNVEENTEVNHINGNKMDNRVQNLEWCNRSYNTKHAVDTGLKPILRGSEIGTSTLTEDDVRLICKSLLKYNGNVAEVLRHVTSIGINTSYDAIIAIKIKQNWSWLSDEYFVKNYFSMEYEKMIVDICFSLIKHNGDSHSTYTELKDIYPNLSLGKIRHVRNKDNAVKISDKIFPKGIFDRKQEVLAMEKNNVTKEMLDMYTRAWSHGVPLIEDDDYDMLVEEYVKNNGENSRPFMRNKQSAAVNDVVGTLSKVYGVKEPMRSGQKTYADWVDSLLKNHGVCDDAVVIVQPKYDGCSLTLDVKTGRYFTRGDYDNGESMDVTELFGNRVYLHGDANDFAGLVSVKFEAIMSEEAFYDLRMDQKYVNARAATSAIIMSRDKKLAQYISLQPLRCYYDDGGMTIPEELEKLSVICSLDAFDTIQNFIDERLADGAKVLVGEEGPYAITNAHYAIDGVVVSVLENDHSCELMKPHMEIAIKILNNIKETKIIDIEWQMGKTGKITPVGILEPVTFDNGVTVDHVSLSTFDRVYNLGLHYGDTVRVMHNIVPYLLDSKHDGCMIIPLPTNCPICGSPLDMTNLKTVRCTNPNCKNNKLGDIIRYCENMKMMGISKGILSKLYDLGYVRTIADLYTINYEELALERGFAETSVRALQDSIRKASVNVPLERFLSALPCTNVSKKTWRMILDSRVNQTFMETGDGETEQHICDALVEESPNNFLKLITGFTYGVGDTTWKAIHFGIRTYWGDISRAAYNVAFQVNYLTDDDKNSNGLVCFTGHRDRDLAALLAQNGYDVTDDLTNSCVALVIPDEGYFSSKVKRAIKKGIPILTIDSATSNLNSMHKIV